MSDSDLTIQVSSAQAMERLGARFAEHGDTGLVIYLSGDLGAGKTTFVRGFMQAMGHSGAVKSPTFTLVEPYELKHGHVYHLDLYRLSSPEELEFLGFRDYFEQSSTCLVEWPERAQGLLPTPDVLVNIAYSGSERTVGLVAMTPRGKALLALVQCDNNF